MELIDYRGVLRRWSVLIIAGTLVAALIGYRIALRSREAAHPLYAGTANVVVNYVTPPGVPYIPTLSLHTQTDVLSVRVQDPGVLRRVAARAHVALSQVQGVSTAVDPQKPLITIQVLGTTPRAAAAVAQGLAQYLAGVETQQVQAQAASLSRTAASAVAQAQQRWLAAQTRYYLICGCIAGQYQAQLSKPPTPQRPLRSLSRRPAPRLTRQPPRSPSRRPAPRRTGRPPRLPSKRPAPRLIRQPPRSPAAAQQTATAAAQQVATTVAQQTATVVAGSSPADGQRRSSPGGHRHGSLDSPCGRPAGNQRRGSPDGPCDRRPQLSRRPAPRLTRQPPRSPAAAQQAATATAHQTATAVAQQTASAHAATDSTAALHTASAAAHQAATALAQQTASAAAHQTATAVAGRSSAGRHRHGTPHGDRGRPADGQRRRRNGQHGRSAHGQRRGAPDSHGSSSVGSHRRGSPGGHRGGRPQLSRQPPPQPSRRRPRLPSRRPAPRRTKQPLRSLSRRPAPRLIRQPPRRPAAAQQTAAAIAHQTATAVAQQTTSAAANQATTAVAQQTVAAAAQQTATAAAQQQQMATAAAQQTASAAAHEMATAVAQQTVAVAAQQTATAAGQQRATAVAQQTAIAAAQQTATAAAQQTASTAAHQTATAVAQQTATAADQQTAIAAAEQTATAVAQQTAIAAVEQTAIAAAEQTAIAAAEQTAIAAAEQTATVEPGDPYIPSLSLHTQTDVLSARVQDPGLLRRVAARAHLALSQVQGVSTAVDPQKPLITIQVLGTTPRAAAAVAQGLAQYLAGVETQQVQAQAASLSRTAASAVAQAQQRWLATQTHYYLVCGCIAGQHQAQLSKPPIPQRPPRPLSRRPPPQPSRQPPRSPSKQPPQHPSGQPADAATLAQLRAELDLLQADYAAAANRYTALQSNAVPVATVMPGSVSVMQAPAASPLKAVLLATVVGLVLSSGLAVLLDYDYRRHGLPALARARGAGYAARRDPEPAATLTPGSARPVKAVLLAAGLGLLVCIGLAALFVDGPTLPLLVASHGGARRVHLEERRRPQAAARPSGPLAALPAPPALLLNPDAVHFNHQDGPTRRTAHTIYVVNVGPAPVTIRTITITGADRAAFAEADTCTRSTVGMYGRCTISVRVAPMTGGESRKATLVITVNAPGSPQRVPLSA